MKTGNITTVPSIQFAMSAFAGQKSIMRQIMSMHCHTTPILFWKRKSYSPMMSWASSDVWVSLSLKFGKILGGSIEYIIQRKSALISAKEYKNSWNPFSQINSKNSNFSVRINRALFQPPKHTFNIPIKLLTKFSNRYFHFLPILSHIWRFFTAFWLKITLQN